MAMARTWKPGLIDEIKIKRSGTEAGFKKQPTGTPPQKT